MTQANIPMLVTERDTTPPDGTVVETPPRLPNIVIRTMTPIMQVLVRSARTYVQSLLGLLTVLLFGPMVSDTFAAQIPPGDLLRTLELAAGFALAPTAVSFLQNLLELLAKLDESFPKLRA